MIQVRRSPIQLAKNNREILTEKDEDFPCICVLNENSTVAIKEVPWHWHDMIEFNYVIDGEVRIFTQDHTYNLKRGDLIFINSNVLHHMDFLENVKYYALLLDYHFLSGAYNSAIEQKYFTPILRCANLPSVLLQPVTPRRIRMVENMITAVEAMRDEETGFELTVREQMSRLWMRLFDETEEIRANSLLSSNQDVERMKVMLEYIYAHYMEPITLDEIAASAGVSGRECTRCFQRSVGSSPIRFLIDYRVHLAAEKLLLTSEPISVISEKCGFASDSYFGKTFREYFGCTPREYRKQK